MNQYVNEDLNEDLIIENIHTAFKSSLNDEKKISSKEKVRIKNAILNIVLSLVLFSTVGLLLSKIIITGLENQMPFDVNFVQLNPFEIFNSSAKVAIFFGLYISSPFILYNLSRIYSQRLESINIDNKFLLKTIASSFFLFAAGILFAYYLAIPGLLYFIMGFNSSLATTAINISSYTSFCLQLIILTGLVFELPIFYIILNKTRLCGSKKLISLWKPALIGSAISAFLLTSQDLLSLIFSTCGIITLYGLCIFIAKLVEHN